MLSDKILFWAALCYSSVVVDVSRPWNSGDDGLTKPTASTSLPVCNDTVKQRFIDIIYEKDPTCLYHLILPDGKISKEECRCILLISHSTPLAEIGNSCQYDVSHKQSMFDLWKHCNKTYDLNPPSPSSTADHDLIDSLPSPGGNKTINNTTALWDDFLIPTALMITVIVTLIFWIIYYSKMKNAKPPDIEEGSVQKPRTSSLSSLSRFTVECNFVDTPSCTISNVYQDWGPMGTPTHADYFHCTVLDSPTRHHLSTSSNVSFTAEEISSQTKFVIPEDDIIINTDSALGHGAHGAVYTGCYHGTNVACKTVSGHLDAYLREGDLFFQLSSHPNICQCYGVSVMDNQVYLVSELFRDNSLLSVMKGGKLFSMAEKVVMCRQLAAAVLHLHRANVLHCDIALRNVLIDTQTKRIALTDFGNARRVGDKSDIGPLAVRWTAPEVFSSKIFTKASDVYSLGITHIELIENGALPFHKLSTKMLLNKSAERKEIPEISETSDQVLLSIIQSCLKSDPLKRNDIQSVFNSWSQYEKVEIERTFLQCI